MVEVRPDWLLDHCGVRTVCCHRQPSLGDFQPFQQIIGKQHIAAQVAHLFGRLKLRPKPRQLRLRLALVALFGKPQRDPFRFPLPFGVSMVRVIAKYAKDRADQADADRNTDAARAFRAVAYKGNSVNGNDYLQAFDAMTSCFSRCMKNTALMSHWDELNGEIVERF